MAHVQELPRCSWCREPASSELFNARSISIGRYCPACIGLAFKHQQACERDLVMTIFNREESK